MTLKIREAKTNESKVLSNLALRSKAYWGYSQEFIDACRQELTYLQKDIQNNHFFVGEIDNSIIGFYGLTRISNSIVELEALFLEPSYMNQGYGSKLIEHAKSTAMKLGSKVMIIQGDPNAKNFYLKIGGKLTGQKESDSIPGRYLPTFMIELTVKS